jgi:hypothetical protein
VLILNHKMNAARVFARYAKELKLNNYNIDRIANGVLLTVSGYGRHETFAFRNMNAVIRKIKEIEAEDTDFVVKEATNDGN